MFVRIAILVAYTFSPKLDRCVKKNSVEKTGCCTVWQKKIYFISRSCYRFRRDFPPVIRRLFALSLYSLYAAVFNYLIQWVIVIYLLVNISVANSHATSAYKCELLIVTCHYLPTVRLDNAGSVIRLSRPSQHSHILCILFTRQMHFLSFLNLLLCLF